MASGSIQAPTVQNPTIPGFSMGGGGGGGQSDSASFTGIENPEALALLMQFLQASMSGGDSTTKAMQKERQTQIASTRASLGDYSKGAAFSDAAAMIAQSLRKSMESAMPAISKAIQGAGTSASSMQGLLAQRAATEASQAAGTLGAQQAASYGNIASSLQSVLEALTRPDNTNSSNILGALGLLKNQKSVSTQTQNPTNPQFSVTASGGGSSIASRNTSLGSASPYQDGVWYGPGGVPRSQDWVSATAGLPQVSGWASPFESYGPAGAALTSEELLGLAEGPNWGYGD